MKNKQSLIIVTLWFVAITLVAILASCNSSKTDNALPKTIPTPIIIVPTYDLSNTLWIESSTDNIGFTTKDSGYVNTTKNPIFTNAHILFTYKLDGKNLILYQYKNNNTTYKDTLKYNVNISNDSLYLNNVFRGVKFK